MANRVRYPIGYWPEVTSFHNRLLDTGDDWSITADQTEEVEAVSDRPMSYWLQIRAALDRWRYIIRQPDGRLGTVVCDWVGITEPHRIRRLPFRIMSGRLAVYNVLAVSERGSLRGTVHQQTFCYGSPELWRFVLSGTMSVFSDVMQVPHAATPLERLHAELARMNTSDPDQRPSRLDLDYFYVHMQHGATGAYRIPLSGE